MCTDYNNLGLSTLGKCKLALLFKPFTNKYIEFLGQKIQKQHQKEKWEKKENFVPREYI